jgi:peptidoglycan-associated lipoprotein
MEMPKLFVRLFLAIAAALFANSAGLSAQSVTSMEAGGSYSFVRANAPAGNCGCFSMNGGAGWFAYNFRSSLALVGEIGGTHASSINGTMAGLTLASFLGGPRYSWRHAGKFTPFAQLLMGVDRASGALTPAASGLAGSATAFAATVGGGVDYAITRRLSFRAAQLDYYLTRFDNGVNNHQNNFRFGVGVVVRFGREE